jgi:hypothetical protein
LACQLSQGQQGKGENGLLMKKVFQPKFAKKERKFGLSVSQFVTLEYFLDKIKHRNNRF